MTSSTAIVHRFGEFEFHPRLRELRRGTETIRLQDQPYHVLALMLERTGDVITALNGEAISDPNTFRNKIAGTPPGGEITLNVRRDGREQQVRATLGEFTPEAERPRE